MGRAALLLAEEGIDVVFGLRAEGGELVGARAVPGRWEPARSRVVAAYCRYPSQSDPEGYARLLAGLEAPVHNPVAPTLLCRDKVACQHFLEGQGIPQPSIETDPDHFSERLASWGAGFLKPRHGAFGRGVRHVLPGDPLPSRGEGAVPGTEDALFLQAAVPPPHGWAGVSVRVLVQRLGEGWMAETPAARCSRTDPVVNAARGAEVLPAETLTDARALVDLALATAEALSRSPDGDGLIELGVDLAVDRERRPWVIEVNSRPRGRLEALAAHDPRFVSAHVEACARPLRWLAGRYGG